MVDTRLVIHAARMVRSISNRTGMMGCLARLSHQTNDRSRTMDNGTVARTRGWVHGTTFPPAFNPSSSVTRKATVRKERVKSMRETSDLFQTFGGILTRM